MTITRHVERDGSTVKTTNIIGGVVMSTYKYRLRNAARAKDFAKFVSRTDERGVPVSEDPKMCELYGARLLRDRPFAKASRW